MGEVPQEKMMSMILGQLKQYGFYSAAKQIGDMIGSNPEASNQLSEICKNVPLDFQAEEKNDFKDSSKEKDYLVFEDSKSKFQKSSYEPWYTTQHREGCRASGI
jgi:hypothetical protein